MQKNNVLIIAASPLAIHGQGTYTKMLLKHLNKCDIQYKILPIFEKKSKYDNEILIIIEKISSYINLTFSFIKHILFYKTVYLSPGRTTLGFFRDMPIIWISFLLKKRILLHFHCGDYNVFYDNSNSLVKYLIRLTINRVNYFILLSNKLVENLYFIQNKSKKIIILPNGIEVKGCLTKKSIQNSEIKILYLSNLIESKGYLSLLRAIEILVKKHNVKVKCRFCGSFISDKDDIETKGIDSFTFFNSLVDSMNIQDSVEYLGKVRDFEKEKLISDSDFFVLPTYYKAEAQPISILEAMARGVVVLSTNYRAIPDMVFDNYTGCYITQEPTNIAAKIVMLTKNDDMYNYLRKNAFDLVKNNFNIEYSFEALINLFKTNK